MYFTHIHIQCEEIKKEKREGEASLYSSLKHDILMHSMMKMFVGCFFLTNEWDEERAGLWSCNLFLRQKDSCAL